MNSIEIELLEKAQKYKESIILYKDLYSMCEMKEFKEIPLLRKKDLIEDQKRFPPFGSGIGEYACRLKRIHRTTGTSDMPLLLALTQNDINNVIATGRKAFENVGVSKGDVVINCMNYCMWMGGFMDHQSLESTEATVIPYGVGNTENLIQLIKTIPNVCIHATPSYLGKIEKVAKEKFGLEPYELKIHKGFFGGEGGLADKSFRDKLEKRWGMEIYDANYGMSEVMSIIASEGQEKEGLHFIASETLYPELYVDGKASNRNIKVGNVGELVLTHKCKETQPLMRYATGDIIEIINVEEMDVINKFTFKVVGRSDDMLVVKGINFYPASIRNIVSEYEELTGNYQIQVLEKGIVDYVKLLVEKNSTNNNVDYSELKRKLSIAIRKKYFVSCDVEFVDNLVKEENKLKLVKKVESFE